MHPALASLVQRGFLAASVLAKKKFDLETHIPGAISRATLRGILERHKDTEFGRRHGFASIRDVRDYKARVPLATYADFRRDLERMARGEPNVLTRDAPIAFTLSTGTTGIQKLIPVTEYTSKRQLELFLVSRGALLETVPAACDVGRGVVLMSGVLAGTTEGGYPTGSFTSLLANRQLRRARLPLAAPREVLFVPDPERALYLQLLFALADPDLGFINGSFASGVLDFFQQLEQLGPALVRDLAAGALSPEMQLPAELDGPIRGALRKAPERARVVERAIALGSAGLVGRLWPKLAYASAITSGGFAVYADKLRTYLGAIPLYSPSYIASEAILGINESLGEPLYTFFPRSAFFEFIPTSETDAESPRTVDLDALEPGGRYEIVLTTHGGLYRYRLEDVVEVVRRRHRAPVLRFLHRRGSLLNIVNEKTSEHAAQQAVREACAEERLDLVDFSTMEDIVSSPKRYVFFIELGPGSAPADAGRLAARLEEALRRANPQLALMCSRLGPLALHLVQPGTFAALRGRLIARGATPAQVKIPRVVREGELADLLRSRSG